MTVVGTVADFPVGTHRIVALLGDLEGEPELREPLVGAAQIGQVQAHHGEQP